MSEESKKIDDLQKGVSKNMTDIAVLTEKMTASNEKMDTTNANIEKLCGTIEKNTAQTDEFLRGSKENPGLLVRVDRLENYASRMKKKFNSIAAVLTTAALAFFSWLLGLWPHEH